MHRIAPPAKRWNITDIVGKSELYMEQRDELEEDNTWELNERDMKSFGTVDGGEKTIAIVGDRWRPQRAKHNGNKMCNTF